MEYCCAVCQFTTGRWMKLSRGLSVKLNFRNMSTLSVSTQLTAECFQGLCRPWSITGNVAATALC